MACSKIAVRFSEASPKLPPANVLGVGGFAVSVRKLLPSAVLIAPCSYGGATGVPSDGSKWPLFAHACAVGSGGIVVSVDVSVTHL